MTSSFTQQREATELYGYHLRKTVEMATSEWDVIVEPVWVFELISQRGVVAAADYGQAKRQLSSRGGRITAVSEWGSLLWKQGTWCTLALIFTWGRFPRRVRTSCGCTCERSLLLRLKALRNEIQPLYCIDHFTDVWSESLGALHCISRWSHLSLNGSHTEVYDPFWIKV